MNRLKNRSRRIACSIDSASPSTSVACFQDKSRRGHTNIAIVVLLTLILVAIVALILVILFKPNPVPPLSIRKSVLNDGETEQRDKLLVQPVAPPKPVAKPNRIKESLKQGKTYRVILKEGFQSRVEDSQWSAKVVVNITFQGEHEIIRNIESNDGQRIVELRHFAKSRAVKVLSEVEQAKLDLGLPGMLVLGALESYAPGTIATVAAATPVLEAIFHTGTNIYLADKDAKVVASVDSLAGKRIQIVYTDGVGVESVTPVGCTLSEDERDFAFATAILSDCYLFPELDKKEGESWSVDGSQFAFLFDPSWRGQPMGSVTLVRDKNQDVKGQPHAVLNVGHGLVTLNATDQSRKRQGTFTPTGQVTYALTDGYIDGAQMQGKLTIEEMSKDHLLFATIFKSTPTVTINYSCQIQP